jgi:hypothetical protein
LDHASDAWQGFSSVATELRPDLLTPILHFLAESFFGSRVGEIVAAVHGTMFGKLVRRSGDSEPTTTKRCIGVGRANEDDFAPDPRYSQSVEHGADYTTV